ncbi:MAG: hypothetical protein JWN78_141 [Bacteroidota bacterium]|nr:hypothetical protein [Bacteroidota bacterium]
MRSFKISLIVTIIVALILIVINHYLDGTFWKNWTIEPSVAAQCFCEHNYMERFIRQPVNTWSNLAFLFFGIAILQQSLKSESNIEGASGNKESNYLKRQRLIGICYGILLCILFTGSFMFHASLTVFFGITDMIGTYGIPLFLGMIAITRILVYHKILKEKTAAILCVTITFALGFSLAIRWIIFINMIVTFASLLSIAAIAAAYLFLRKDLQFNKKLFALIFAVILTACTLWILDHNNICCYPYSNIQGHSFWHVLNASAAYLMYEYFYSEKEA